MATATRTRKPRARKASEPKQDTYQVVTDQIIEMLEAGTAPWHQPWDAAGGMALSMSTGKPYRGINVLLLQMVAMTKGYHSPWWGTYKQIMGRLGVTEDTPQDDPRRSALKGQKGAQVVLWRRIPVEDEKTGEKKLIWLLRTFYVFNADQVAGELNLPEVEPRPVVEAIEECEAALRSYYAAGPELLFGGDRAAYSPGADVVYMPERDQFHSAEEFYGTWFHETIHSTGHKDRLARKDLLDFHSFGDPSYSREELVAEMGAAFLSAHTGIAVKTLASSASYLDSWIKVLKGDKKLIVHAAAQAQKAADLVLGNAIEYTDADPAETATANAA